MQVLTLKHGDCIQRMAEMPDGSVDAIVCDPPYGIKFFGKSWDDMGAGAQQREWHKGWLREAHRVLSSGGSLWAFSGSRTQHHLAAAMVAVGFDELHVRVWNYSQGFPKSLDVTKAIDRMDASEEQEQRKLRFTAWVRSTGVTAKQIDEATSTKMGSHYTTLASQPQVMTRKHLEACRHLLGEIPAWVERECDIRSIESRNMTARPVIGYFQSSLGGTVAAGERNLDYITKHKELIVSRTAPASEAARQWQGYGTALRPAWEPVVCGRKPC